MGHNPIPPAPRVTRLEATRRAYIGGRITTERFEQIVSVLFASGTQEEAVWLRSPPKPIDAAESVRPA